MENTANRISLVGTLAERPVLSHTNHERNFYRFMLEVARLSGACDLLPVVAAEDVLLQADLFQGYQIAVSGQIRSFNSKSETGRRLIISVFAESVTTTDREHENELTLTGAICKPPVLRRTPLGREICDVMLAVNRPYRRTDYIPCILWGRLAQQTAEYPVGTVLTCTGRLQSREYIKVLPDRSETRTAYEVSVTTAEPAGEAEHPQ